MTDFEFRPKTSQFTKPAAFKSWNRLRNNSGLESSGAEGPSSPLRDTPTASHITGVFHRNVNVEMFKLLCYIKSHEQLKCHWSKSSNQPKGFTQKTERKRTIWRTLDSRRSLLEPQSWSVWNKNKPRPHYPSPSNLWKLPPLLHL